MIVAVTNIKGGCGKTTSAIALASAAAAAGVDACVLDADPQGSATEWALTAQDIGDPLPFGVKSANVASIRRLEDGAGWTIIDCPPSGAVTDEAVSVADFVVVPASSSPVDLAKTWETVSALEAQGKAHGVLLTKVQANTITYRSAVSEIDETGTSSFDARIPKREAIASFFGHAFGDELYGYQDVFAEIKEAVEDGDQ